MSSPTLEAWQTKDDVTAVTVGVTNGHRTSILGHFQYTPSMPDGGIFNRYLFPKQNQHQRQRTGEPAPHFLLCRPYRTSFLFFLTYGGLGLRLRSGQGGALFFRRFAACALWGWVRASTGNPICEPHHEQLRNQNQSQKQRTGVSAPHRHQRLLAWGRSFRVLASWPQASR
jgi:hypothetical protein